MELFGDGKRYRGFDVYCRERFGEKVVKVPLDGGFTCPNRDGTRGFGGCVFCAGGGGEAYGLSGKRSTEPLSVQFEHGREALEKKWGRRKAIAYFQSYTSTYAPVEKLRALYEEALSFEDVVGLTVATRADALPADVLELLTGLNERTALTVELGLQTVHDESARRINRGHDFRTFLEGFSALKERGIAVCVHLINGLPGETREMMTESAERLAEMKPDLVKFHELYVRKDAPIYADWLAGKLRLLSREEYVEILADQIERMPRETAIERLTGDPLRSAFAAPDWALDKKKTIALLDRTLARRGTFQGICAK